MVVALVRVYVSYSSVGRFSMSRLLLPLTFALLLSASGMAQTSPSANANQIPGSNDNSSDRTIVVRGCLSATADGYALTQDQTGKTFVLTGNTASLKGHEGQEVEVTGQRAVDNSSASTNNSRGTSLAVSKEQVFGKHCGQPSQQPSGAGMTGKNDQNADAGISGDSDVPKQNATPLSLVGLIGLGSLLAGFFMRK